MTAKNRRLVKQLEDPAFVDRLVTLPLRLAQASRAMSDPRRAAAYARDAVVAELLLTCSMRVGNLAALRLGETIRRYGEGRDARWVIDLPAEQVKNREPLRYQLLPESGRLVEWYLETWHHRWCGPGSPWLFPAKGGGHIAEAFVTTMMKARARRYVGVPITCHQFRHLAAELYLREDPNGIGVVGQHLGHRSLTTTRTFYAREQTRIATQRYHNVLARARAKATTGRRRAKPAGKRT
jgi:integrase